MRLKSVHISQYKNLKDFKLDFDGESFIDVFVGKNGTGKSNLFEALLEIFRHLYESNKKEKYDIAFDYSISYEINSKTIEIKWREGKFTIKGEQNRKTLGITPVPDNVLIYYSGHNSKVIDVVQDYGTVFRKTIKTAEITDTNKFVGIDKEYKQILLAVLLIQQNANKIKECIQKKLRIKDVGKDLRVVLRRPYYALSNTRYDVVLNDETDRFWKPEGITKEFLDRLEKCVSVSSGPIRAEGYFNKEDKYIRYFKIEAIQKEFKDVSALTFFRHMEKLKAIEMLEEISLEVVFESGKRGEEISTKYFSDGQFQLIYIYTLIELFKEQNCLILLDEPDCFLHPEWQFGFLKQIFDITDIKQNNNHILMTSHSALTISKYSDAFINFFDIGKIGVVVNKVSKANVINSLSAGMIVISEIEARLSINHMLNNTSGAVLFVEGITDAIILETAWEKLYPKKSRNFEIENGYGSGFLRNLWTEKQIFENNPNRKFFALYDFDSAYKDWNQLGDNIETDTCKCLTKKYNGFEAYSLLLPIPNDHKLKHQVINPKNGKNYGDKSLFTIESLFYGIPDVDSYYCEDTDRTDSFIRFSDNDKKVSFAKNVVPNLDAKYFNDFKPVFNFIKSKC